MKYLFISSHVDDSELSCGGTIAKLIEQGHEVTVITLSIDYECGNLVAEWNESMKRLAVSRLMIRAHTTRLFFKEQNEILQELYLMQKNGYDFIFAPCSKDFHSDHSVVGRCAERVFKNQNLITYQGCWNAREFKTNYFVSLDKHHIEQKINALSAYESQKNRTYMHSDYIWANALNAGVMCGVKYAESFNAINLIT